MKRVKGWPRGFWAGPRLLAMGVVVLSELPRRRDTLLLRLLGRGRVLREAIDDLKALPADAKERELALPPLIALRFEVTQDPNPSEETRDLLMATTDLMAIYEQWEKRVQAEAAEKAIQQGLQKGRERGMQEGLQQGLQEGLVATLVATYEQRFGSMSQPLRKALAKVVTPDSIAGWVMLFATAPAKEIAAAIRKGHSGR
jgi:hypothetical protein